MPIYKTKNENFFKKWSPQMAYVLGFFTADGNMIKNKRGAHFIEFQSIDKEIIYKIREAFNSNLYIGEYQPKNKNCKKRYRLQIGSKIIFKDLLGLGMAPNKSLTIELPKIPKKYFSDFIRGYFDGDGNVTTGKYIRKDTKKQKVYIISGFTCGSKNFLEKLHMRFKKESDIIGGSLYYHTRGFRLYFSTKDSLSLYNLMYKNIDNSLFLSRKKKIFEKYFKIR
ncbi:hypothetical protein HZB05_00240 [Candidatus Wolfebacteria bacterium]|nr:hypothetical protein [Candidatus Wolfebacteria bacterium]